MDLTIIIAISGGVGVVVIYLGYMCIRNFEPYDPDEIRFGVHLPVVVHVDTRVIPMQTIAEYSNPPYVITNAVLVEEPNDVKQTEASDATMV